MITRRVFLEVAMAALQAMKGKRVVRQASPENLETSLGELGAFLTPVDEHYVRSHFAVPTVDPSTWRLQVRGSVREPQAWSLADLRAMPSVTRVVTMECAGNGRAYLEPAVAGVQWDRGGVSTAEWTGVRLVDLLTRAGVADGATLAVFEGHDRGEVKNNPFPAGTISFHRSLSIDDVRSRDVIVALAMNGQPLPADHGAPARLVVPGCYGMASVKWLSGIEITSGAPGAYWETTDYAYWDRSSGRPVRRPLLGMHVKSVISSPSPSGAVRRGQTVSVVGAAWSDGPVSRIEVSTDGGRTWHAAEFVDPPSETAWRRWRYRWQVPADGTEATLMSRATDTKGRTQPATRNADLGTYVINHTVPIPVTLV